MMLMGRSGHFEAGSALAHASTMSGACLTYSLCRCTLPHPTYNRVSLGAADLEIQGVMLAGGVLQDATLAKQSAASVRAVFAPKV